MKFKNKKEFVKPEKEWWVEWKKPLGNLSCPFAYRYLIGTPLFSIRFHYWKSSDDNRARHTHPWNFITMVLWGQYIDITNNGAELMTPFKIRFRRADHAHWVKIDKPCLSLVITGREFKHWGMWINEKWVKANKYFSKYGHHPCN